MSRRISPDLENELSQRELQLLVHATRGLTDQAIANELGISLATIATYWGRIRIKLGPLNRTELVAKYLEFKSKEEVENLNTEVALVRLQLATSKASDSELLIALNKIPNIVVIIDLDETILYMNEASYRVFGYSPDEIIGNQFLNIYPEGRHELWLAWREEFLANPTNPDIANQKQAFVRHKDGHIVQVIGDAVVYDTAAGSRIMWVAKPVE